MTRPPDAAPSAPLVTDEPVDRWFARPLARTFVPLLARTPLTPNHVTAGATAVGVAAGGLLGLGHAPAAAACIGLYLILDCADGQLARLRGGGGLLGRIADGAGDYLTAIALHVGLIAAIARDHGAVEGVAWGAAAGASLAWVSMLLDRYKRRYRGEFDDLDAVRAEMERSTGFDRFLLRSFLPYARRANASAVVGDLPAYRARVRGPLRVFLFTGPTSHLTLLALLLPFGHERLYAILTCLPVNALVLAGFLWQRSSERALSPKGATPA